MCPLRALPLSARALESQPLSTSNGRETGFLFTEETWGFCSTEDAKVRLGLLQTYPSQAFPQDTAKRGLSLIVTVTRAYCKNSNHSKGQEIMENMACVVSHPPAAWDQRTGPQAPVSLSFSSYTQGHPHTTYTLTLTYTLYPLTLTHTHPHTLTYTCSHPCRLPYTLTAPTLESSQKRIRHT